MTVKFPEKVLVEENQVKSQQTLNDVFMLFLKAGLVSDVLRLLNEGADPNHVDSKGRTALMIAVPELALVQILGDFGADPEKPAKNGYNALTWAEAHHKYPQGRECVEHLEYLIDRQKHDNGTN